MNRLMTLMLGLMFAVEMTGMAVAGSIDSPGFPSAGSGMYTLQNLYDYLINGTAPTVQTGFQEPTSAPGSTMKKTKQIYDDIKGILDQCDATPNKVLQGTKFFSTISGSWGLRTGTALIQPTPSPTITPTTTPTPWVLGESKCNAITGWHWYNGACWSDAIADCVSWSAGFANDTSNTGSYTCNSAGTLQSRMEAAVAGRWSEICTSINGLSIDSTYDGATGKPYITAMAISDCVDGTRDIGPTIDGSTWQTRSNTLKNWAKASGHSALPAVNYDGSDNEFQAACSGDFFRNTSSLSPGDNYCWAAACGSKTGGGYDTNIRILASVSCTYDVEANVPQSQHCGGSFRVVVRP